jgi:orotate phosphoribosyltransferase
MKSCRDSTDNSEDDVTTTGMTAATKAAMLAPVGGAVLRAWALSQRAGAAAIRPSARPQTTTGSMVSE